MGNRSRLDLIRKTRNAAKARIEKRIGTPQWLLENRNFDQSLRFDHPALEKFFDQLIEGLRIYKRQEKIRDMSIILANLFYSWLRRKKCVAIPRGENHYTATRYTRSSYFTVKLMDLLAAKGMIKMEKGYYSENESRLTRIWPTKCLLEWFPEMSKHIRSTPLELVVLKDKNGKLKEYRDTAKTIRIRKILERANSVNAARTILYKDYEVSTDLYAIFIEKFTLYGRLHTRGDRHYQGMSENVRQQMTIDGEPVVELDYSGLHPRLLYAAEGIQYDDDPYAEVDDRPEARSTLKVILLRLLNIDSIELAKAKTKWALIIDDEKREELEAIGLDGEILVNAFLEAHRPIAHHLCQGKKTGLRLMNKDSRIALDVVDHFTRQGKPILVVHDSFIVQSRYESELRKVMVDKYAKHTGGFSCPIK